jgi:hypothetical protein
MTLDHGLQSRANSLGDWILLCFFRRSERRHILDVPVGVPADLRDGDAVFAKITGAFELLRAHGGRTVGFQKEGTRAFQNLAPPTCPVA